MPADEFTLAKIQAPKQEDLARYLEAQYSIKFSPKLMSGLSPAGWQYDPRCKQKLKALCNKLTTEIKVIEKEN